ncbi:MAG: hypothetical protein U0166_04075 [Acidobacteriota bacterium]
MSSAQTFTSRARRRKLLVVALALAAIMLPFAARPFVHLGLAALADRSDAPPPPAGSLDDASRREETRVAEVFAVPEDPAQAEDGSGSCCGAPRARASTCRSPGRATRWVATP